MQKLGPLVGTLFEPVTIDPRPPIFPPTQPSPTHGHPVVPAGALLDMEGRLVGITTAIFTNTGTSAGIGFAIPAATVAGVVGQLIAYGAVTRPSLGIKVGGRGPRVGIVGMRVRVGGVWGCLGGGEGGCIMVSMHSRRFFPLAV